MDLLSLKKEVEQLGSIQKDLKLFQDTWFKLVSSPKSVFLQNLSGEKKEETGKRIKELKESIPHLEEADLLNEKLRSYVHHLVELKLTSLRGDERKSQIITNHLLYDEYLSLSRAIGELKAFYRNLNSLSLNYNYLNEIFREKMTLEESLPFLDASHRRSLANIRKVLQQQEKIVTELGKAFIPLAKSEVKKMKVKK